MESKKTVEVERISHGDVRTESGVTAVAGRNHDIQSSTAPRWSNT